MLNTDFMDNNNEFFKNAIPAKNAHLTGYIIRTLGENIAGYEKHVKYLKRGKRRTDIFFRIFLERQDNFLEHHFNEEVYQSWKALIRTANREAAKATNNTTTLSAKHAPLIAFLGRLYSFLTYDKSPVRNTHSKQPSLPTAISDFRDLLIRGIVELQTQGEGQECFRLVQTGKGKREAGVRDFFRTICAGRYEVVESESIKGKGRIDLKVYDTVHKTRLIVEFKGLWNYKHKGRMINQLTEYLTDADGYAFTVTINHLKKYSRQQHRQLIVQRKTGYIAGSYKSYEDKQVTYWASSHRVNGRTIQLFHFVLSIPQKSL